MGVVTEGVPGDVILPGPGLGDHDPLAHEVVAFDRWQTVARCYCGVLARADHRLRAYVGPDAHFLPFGASEYAFTLSGAPEASDGPTDDEPADRREPSPRNLAVLAALGIEPETDESAPPD